MGRGGVGAKRGKRAERNSFLMPFLAIHTYLLIKETDSVWYTQHRDPHTHEHPV